MRVDEKTARRAGTSISPAWPTKARGETHLSLEIQSPGERVGYYDFSHTVTEHTLPVYSQDFPGIKVGDRINETQIRTSNKVIRSRMVNGRPIPWIPNPLTRKN